MAKSREAEKRVIRRMPPTKVFRAHLNGLATALLFATLAVFIALNDPAFEVAGYVSFGALLLALGGTVALPAFFVFFAAGYWLLTLFTTPPAGSTGAYFQLLSCWYLWGYAFGGIFALLYNGLLYRLIVTFRQDRIVVAFAFDPAAKFNVIKSPDAREVTPHGTGLRNLYDYNIPSPPPHPYTIAFVANPKIPTGTTPGQLADDPITRDVDLFLRAVDEALAVFERDEVLGRPEIWSRIRITALFDPQAPENLVDPYKFDAAEIDGRIAENLLYPAREMDAKYRQMVERHRAGFRNALPPETTSGQANELRNDDAAFSALFARQLKCPDIIFALSAAPRFDRSTAHYSDWVEDAGDPNNLPDKSPFTFDPAVGKPAEEINVYRCGESPFKCEHEHHPKMPGRVALNILGASYKTYIHEFAHAMSNAYRGACVDEYYDRIIVDGEDPAAPAKAPFYINRIERKNPPGGGVIPVHNVFAKYESREYESDREHPSAEEDWLGYFPERPQPDVACTMDRWYGRFRFDKLISDFMYDRLIVKLNRKPREGGCDT